MGCLGCRTHASPVTVVIIESHGLFGLSKPCVTRDSSSLLFYESLGAVWLSNPWVTRDTSSLIISESIRDVWAVEPKRHP
jgi:hypothetical protein